MQKIKTDFVSCSDKIADIGREGCPGTEKPKGYHAPKMPKKIQKIQGCQPGDDCEKNPVQQKVGNECWEYCCAAGQKKALADFAKAATRILNRGTNNKPKKKKRK